MSTQKKSLVRRPFEKFAFVSVRASVSADALAEQANKDLVRSHARRSRIKKKDPNDATQENSFISEENVEKPPVPLAEQLGRFRLKPTAANSKTKRILKARLAVELALESSQTTPAPIEKDVEVLSNTEIDSAEVVSRSNINNTQLQIFRDCGIADPFDSLPISLGTKQQKLLHHYVTNLTLVFFAFDPNRELLSHALSDSAWLHATFSLVALHHDLLSSPGNLSPECLYHRGEALRILNTRLSQPQTIAESSLGAIASLLNFDITIGATHSARMHMSGLQHLVLSRGGLSTFSHNHVLQSLISWSDLLFSSTSENELPTFTFTCPSTSISPACIADVRAYELHILKSPGFNTKMRETIRILRMLSAKKSAVVTSLHKPDISNLDARTDFANCMYLAEYRLLTLFDDVPSNDASRVLRKPWRLGVYLYLHLALRELPSTSPVEKGLSQRLKTALDEGGTAEDLCKLWEGHLSLLTWILFLGAVACEGRVEDRMFFVRRLRIVVENLGISEAGRKGFEAVLKSCLWLESFCTPHAAAVWEEVERSEL